MTRSKWLRVLVLVMVAAMILTLPLAGCKKNQAGQTGGQDTSGQGTAGQGTGGTTGEQGVQFFRFEPGQHLEYDVAVADPTTTNRGSFTLDITDGGSGKINIAFAGNFMGQTFSGTVPAGRETVAEDMVAGMATNPFAVICLLPLIAVPWNDYFAEGQWNVGGKWSHEAGGAKWSFEVTGTETYAGVTGKAGKWTVEAGGETVTCTFCVSQTFPMALHTKMHTTANSWLEYTLVEAAGF